MKPNSKLIKIWVRMIRVIYRNLSYMHFSANYCLGFIITLVCLGCLLINPAWSGGPLIVTNGIPALWPENKTIVYTIDQGALGTFSNLQASSMITRAFNQWNQVSTSWLTFTRNAESLPVDVTSYNFEQILDSLPDNSNPIIFDNDGEIIEALAGQYSKSYILGFASVHSYGNEIVMTRSYYNGYFITQQKQTEAQIFSTLLHEIGHMCGLDHAQHSRHIAFNNVFTDDDVVPIMFPTSTGEEDKRDQLTFDDKLAISNLYSTLFHRTSTGSISGAVKRDNKGLPGVNVIARNIDDPFKQVSTTVTGTFDQNQGTYELKGLPPGNYEVMVEAIDEMFNDYSSVGQYAESSSDRSFRSPIKPEYYNQNDSANESRSTMDLVQTSKSRTTSGIDINVDTSSLPSDEETIRLLAINSKANGAASSNSGSVEYLLEPSGNEGSIVIDVEFSSSASYKIYVERERSSGAPLLYTISGNSQSKTVVIGADSNIPLFDTRYFINVFNSGSSDKTFTISVSNQDITPSPTPTATFTSTPTATFSPTPENTATPIVIMTPTPTPTFTPTPSPRGTPTPRSLVGDVNQDGVINALDIFSFSVDWQESAAAADFLSNINKNRSLVIDYSDLMNLIEIYKTTKEETP